MDLNVSHFIFIYKQEGNPTFTQTKAYEEKFSALQRLEKDNTGQRIKLNRGLKCTRDNEKTGHHNW